MAPFCIGPFMYWHLDDDECNNGTSSVSLATESREGNQTTATINGNEECPESEQNRGNCLIFVDLLR